MFMSVDGDESPLPEGVMVTQNRQNRVRALR
jgi:hypothetical protein